MRPLLQMLAFMMSIAFMAHLSACIFYYMAFLDDLGPHTWVAAYGVEAAGVCACVCVGVRGGGGQPRACGAHGATAPIT